MSHASRRPMKKRVLFGLAFVIGLILGFILSRIVGG